MHGLFLHARPFASADYFPCRHSCRCVWSIRPVDIWNGPAQARPISSRAPESRKDSLSAFFSDDPSHTAPTWVAEEKKYVKYGDVVQLEHATSGTRLVVHPHVPSEFELDGFTVGLASESQQHVEDARFRILPKYKIRQEGDAIRLKDQVSAPNRG